MKKLVKIILNNGKELELVVKEVRPSNNSTLIYKTDDDSIYTVVVDQIAVFIEKTIN